VVSLVSLALLPACRRKHVDPKADPGAASPTPSPGDPTRPPKPKATANVTPPKLPKLGAQAAAPPVHERRQGKGNNVLGTYRCGSVWTGEEDIPLECEEPLDEKKYSAPAVALIPYHLLRAPRANLPATVDHRVDGFEGRVLSQRRAPACTAFAFTSLVDHALGLWTGQPGDVSVMEVWAHYHHPGAGRSVASNIGKSLAKDADWPYDGERAASWSKCGGEERCLGGADQQKLDEVERRGVVIVEEVENLPTGDALWDVIEAKLAAGRDVGIGGTLPHPFRPVGEPGSMYIPDSTQLGKGGHAFTTVGYTHIDGERYFLLKNSWGEKWGDKGYAWAHEQTLRKFVRSGYVVVVDPVGDVGLRRQKRSKAHVDACPGGQAPDSIDGACKPLCGDGAPRHGGYCGVTEDCTRGFVNVAGECVLAAPKAKGSEPKTGIAWSCAPSGCVYTIPGGVVGCKSASCQKSCPAPDFRLGKGRGGLLCLE
jgi:hypothetical protein